MSNAAPAAPVPDPGRRGRLTLAVAESVDAVPGVRRSGRGPIPVATLYPGGEVRGVLLEVGYVTVHVTLTELSAARIQQTGEAVSDTAAATLRTYNDDRTARVVIDDLDIEHLPQTSRRPRHHDAPR